MVNITALIISCQEPQLNRCLAAVRSQSIPFSTVIHMDSIRPECDAFNRGLEHVATDLVMKIDGDVILYPNAVEIVLKEIPEKDPEVYGYNFRLYDDFLKGNIRGVGILRTEAVKKSRYLNILGNDVHFARQMAKFGYGRRNHWSVIGTHFESPDEFQVFRRFYSAGCKNPYLFTTKSFEKHYPNPLYELAGKASEWGSAKRYYPTSHDIEFDRKMYAEFRNGTK